MFRMSNLTIGIAIPCYKGHIHVLPNLLDSIEQQTRKPDMVIIRCSSSTSEDIPYSLSHYSFPVRILFHSEKQNAAENRNVAWRQLNTDIITFVDADDIIHPQKLEIIENCFQNHHVKILMHGLELDPGVPFQHYHAPYHFDINRLVRCPWGSTSHLDQTPSTVFHFHNAQSSVHKSVFNYVQFDESPSNFGREDTIFCTTVITTFPNETAYCPYGLTKYVPSRSFEDR
jgi:glycosyltransferase involved in cell wall biosynthesis